MKRIQFEAITLAAVCTDLAKCLGSKVQAVRQPNENEIVLELYGKGEVRHLLICGHPEFFRVHFVSRRPTTLPSPPQFCTALRTNLVGLHLESVTMVKSDRLLCLDFEGWKLYAELMGKHSNVILVNENNTVLGAMKWVGRSKSKRPIQPQQKYELPPVLRDRPDLSEFAGPPTGIEPRQVVAEPSAWKPGLSMSAGAYPFDLSATYSDWVPAESISRALEDFYLVEVQRQDVESKRSWLSSQVERVLLAREVALASLLEAREAGGKAAKWQRYGELLLAYAGMVGEGSETTDLFDYDGSPLTIKLDPGLDAKDNALRYFEKAKKAKGRQGLVSEQIERIEASVAALRKTLAEIEEAHSVQILEGIEEEVRKNRWLHEQPVAKGGTAERPYEGHKIREILGPSNYRILYGDTAEANDYLTLRVAKSNDYWLHVRGHTSAHVVIQTHNQPDKVGREVLLAAAKIAVQHSNQKHAGYVPVDYTLKKYVRKPKGAPKGTALYVNEKTLHVEG
ncbi:MAG: NFACT family protein [Armatimonadetes bacterium]|nr:NFACT family protein [Armatimonadota bacterium]